MTSKMQRYIYYNVGEYKIDLNHRNYAYGTIHSPMASDTREGYVV